VRAGAKDPLPQRLAQTFGHPVERARQQVRDQIFAKVTERQYAGLIAALVVGDQNAIDGRRTVKCAGQQPEVRRAAGATSRQQIVQSRRVSGRRSTADRVYFKRATATALVNRRNLFWCAMASAIFA
jgi:hypothetical protein